MDKWYISIQNKAKGPYTDLQMRKKIQDGDVDGETLAYREGEQDWKPLEDQEIWSPTFPKEEGVNFKVDEKKEWVLLVGNPIKKDDYVQEGPFTKDEVRGKIDSGDLHLKDFCWKPGMESWKSLAKMPELTFSRQEQIVFKEEKVDKPIHVSDLVGSHKSESSTSVLKLCFETIEAETNEFVELEKDSEVLLNKPSQKKTEKLFRFKEKIKALPSKKDEQAYKKSVSTYLATITVVFLMSFVLGYYQSEFILKILSSFERGVASVTNFIAPSTKVSYIFVKQSVLQKYIFHVKTDLKEGQTVFVKVLNEKNKSVPTKNKQEFLNLRVDRLGLAEVDVSLFKVEPFKSYKVVVSVGKFKASKWYTHVRK